MLNTPIFSLFPFRGLHLTKTEKKTGYPHLKKEYKTVKHRHPKRLTQITEADYGDMVERTVLTALEKPQETIYQKNKEINPEKISFGYLGTAEVFSYKNSRDFFYIGFDLPNKPTFRVNLQNWRSLLRIGCRINNYYRLDCKKKAKK